jgi:hypothetical protein
MPPLVGVGLLLITLHSSLFGVCLTSATKNLRNDGIASSDRLRADDFGLFPSRGLVASDVFPRFRYRNANGVAPSQFDATRSGKDPFTGHSIVRAPLYGMNPFLLKLASNALKVTPLRVVWSIQRPGSLHRSSTRFSMPASKSLQLGSSTPTNSVSSSGPF